MCFRALSFVRVFNSSHKKLIQRPGDTPRCPEMRGGDGQPANKPDNHRRRTGEDAEFLLTQNTAQQAGSGD